jgi:hypothetical protein
MTTIGNARKDPMHSAPWPALATERPTQSGKNGLLAAGFCRTSTLDSGLQFEKNSLLNVRNGKAIENEGPLQKTGAQSGNVYEQKGT